VDKDVRKIANQGTALEIQENQKITLETHSRIQNARGQRDDHEEDRRTTPQVLMTTRADLTAMDADISPIIAQKTILETPESKKTTLETHSTFQTRVQNARGKIQQPVNREVVKSERGVDVMKTANQRTALQTTLETPESEKTTQDAHWEVPTVVQTVRDQKDHHVKDLRGSQRTTLKAQTLTRMMMTNVVSVEVDVSMDVDVLDEDDAVDKANHW